MKSLVISISRWFGRSKARGCLIKALSLSSCAFSLLNTVWISMGLRVLTYQLTSLVLGEIMNEAFLLPGSETSNILGDQTPTGLLCFFDIASAIFCITYSFVNSSFFGVETSSSSVTRESVSKEESESSISLIWFYRWGCSSASVGSCYFTSPQSVVKWKLLPRRILFILLSFFQTSFVEDAGAVQPIFDTSLPLRDKLKNSFIFCTNKDSATVRWYFLVKSVMSKLFSPILFNLSRCSRSASVSKNVGYFSMFISNSTGIGSD